jgi:hypothetical protein
MASATGISVLSLTSVHRYTVAGQEQRHVGASLLAALACMLFGV